MRGGALHEQQGKVAPGSKVDVARSGVGIGVKAGAPRPDISTPDALKRAVLAAKSVGFSKEGASGGLAAEAKEVDAAKALIRFLAGPAAATVYRAKGPGG